MYSPLNINAGEYLALTPHFTVMEHGATALLMTAMFARGGYLPNDDDELRRITRCRTDVWRKIKPTVMEMFDVTQDGRLFAPWITGQAIRAARRVSPLNRITRGADQ